MAIDEQTINNIKDSVSEIDMESVTETGEQILNDANATVNRLSDYFGVDTLVIWIVAVLLVALAWRFLRKLGKVAVIVAITIIILAAAAGTVLI